MDKKKITIDDVPNGVNQIPSAKSNGDEPAKQTVSKELRSLSKYQMSGEEHFKIEFGILLHEGRWRIVDLEKLEHFPEAEEHWVKFKMCPYGLQTWIKNQATNYDKMLRIHKFDNDLANRIRIQKLLVDWSFSSYDESCKIHHVGGVMTDESYGLFENMQPNIVNYIINKMNEVLDYNG